MNNVVLVGRLTKKPEITKVGEKGKRTTVVVAVTRNYKNSSGVYETDFIRCVLWNTIATNACEYCSKGDVVGIKGRIETSNYEDENNETKYMTEIVVEKITFLSSVKDKKE
ncbi:MAG: single-stranded DNA-binding protein [bacterium]